MIVAIGSAADDTFMHTVLALRRRNVAVSTLDLVHLVIDGDFELCLSNPTSSRLYVSKRTVSLEGARSLLARLIDVECCAPPPLRERAMSVIEGLSALCKVFPTTVVNRPPTDASNASKILHQSIVGPAGPWRVPDSIVTNDRQALKDFIGTFGPHLVIKGASGQKTWASLLSEEHLEVIEKERFSPVLVQRQIQGHDVRVHVVRDRVFAEAVYSRSVDYRVRRDNTYREVAVPAKISGACVDVCRQAGLELMGLDFKVEESTGQWYFLEANPSPCYEGYDRRLGYAISNAIVDILVR